MARKRRTGLSSQSKEVVSASGNSVGRSPRATVPPRASKGKEVRSAQILQGSGLLSVSLLPGLERRCSLLFSAPQLLCHACSQTCKGTLLRTADLRDALQLQHKFLLDRLIWVEDCPCALMP